MAESSSQSSSKREASDVAAATSVPPSLQAYASVFGEDAAHDVWHRAQQLSQCNSPSDYYLNLATQQMAQYTAQEMLRQYDELEFSEIRTEPISLIDPDSQE